LALEWSTTVLGPVKNLNLNTIVVQLFRALSSTWTGSLKNRVLVKNVAKYQTIMLELVIDNEILLLLKNIHLLI
jgi:hypothetical protein